MSRLQRFSDPAVQQAAGGIYNQVLTLAAQGQAEAAATLLCKFAESLEVHLGGSPGRSLAQILAGRVVGDTEDGRFLWLMIADLLSQLAAVRRLLLAELEAAFDAPTTAPQVAQAILMVAGPSDMAGAAMKVYRRLAACPDLIRRHATFQRLGLGWGGLHAAHPELQGQRHAERSALIDAFGRLVPVSMGPPLAGRLALLAPRLAGNSHSPTRALLCYLTALQDHGIEIALFLTHDIESTADETMLFRRQVWHAFPSDQLPGIPVTALDLEADRLTGVRRLTDSLAAWAPSAIVSFGAGDSMVRGLFARHLPVVEVLLNAAVAPLPEAPAYLGPATIHQVRDELDRLGLTDRLPRYHEHAGAVPVVVPGPPPNLPEVPAGAITIATVSNTLQTVIDDRLAGAMADRLTRDPRLYWLVVGPNEPPAFVGREFHGRMVRRSFEPDLASFLQRAQIYLNPPLSMGGGFAAADALAAGVPVVALAGSDPGIVIGVEWAAPDEAALWAQLDGLLADPAAAAARGIAMAEDLRRRRAPSAAAEHLLAVLAAVTP